MPLTCIGDARLKSLLYAPLPDLGQAEAGLVVSLCVGILEPLHILGFEGLVALNVTVVKDVLPKEGFFFTVTDSSWCTAADNLLRLYDLSYASLSDSLGILFGDS